jgi:hypothetical protein
MHRTILAALALTLTPAAQAARPFITDDARLTAAGSCQLESWMRTFPDSREIWVQPGCNPTGNLEFTFGGGRTRNEGEAFTSDVVFQLKTLLRPLETNGWGWGVAAGVIRHPSGQPGPNRLGNHYAYVPVSVSFDDDRVVVHANAGWLRERETSRHNATWGLGAELKMSSRIMAIAETFGDNHTRPYWQAGARYAIVPDKVQVDATIGRQFSGPSSGRWISIGFRLTPDRLF